jgi:hypothetical protein
VYAKRVTPSIARSIVAYLEHHVERGYHIVTWNGLRFDFPVLVDECPDCRERIAKIALAHIDMAFCMYAERAYMISLDTAAEAMKVQGKTEGMHGDLAPLMWSGEMQHASDEQKTQINALNVIPGSRSAQNLCLEYVLQDAKATADVYAAIIAAPYVRWINRRGTRVSDRTAWRVSTIDGRMLTVSECLELPDPDTSWMSRTPDPKASFVEWMDAVT